MDGPGFHVEAGVLEAAAAGIGASADEQRDSALDRVDREADTYGHGGLHRAMADFCDRWSVGLDILVEDARAVADILSRAAWAYRDADAASAGRLTADPARRVVDD